MTGFSRVWGRPAVFAVAAMLAGIAPAAAPGIRTYEKVADWAKLPEGTRWNDMMAVDIDARGDIYVLQRTPSKVMVFDRNGTYLRAWGEGQFQKAHGLRIDADGNVWTTDRGLHIVRKFSRDGTLLMELGTRGVAGDNASTTALNGPSDVAVAADGTIFVADGESTNTRIMKYTKDGRLIKYWGTKGSGPGQLLVPHSVVIDRQGRLLVGNRGNKRIEIFDQDGGYLGQIANAGTPYGLFVDRKGILYVSDGTKGGDEGVTVLDMKSGRVLAHMSGLEGAHMLTVDRQGAIYLAQVRGTAVTKFVAK